MPKMEWCIIDKETDTLLTIDKDEDGRQFIIIFDSKQQAEEFMSRVRMPDGVAEITQKIIFGPKCGYVDAIKWLEEE
jgi:hypothetical protein